MRIAQIVCTFPPYYGGMGNAVYQTAAELAKLGHEVEVLTPQYWREEIPGEIKSQEKEQALPIVKEQMQIQEDLNVKARMLEPKLQFGNAAYIPQIQNELDDFDLVHLHYPFFGVANLVRKWKMRNPHKPLVITYHMDTRAPGFKGWFFRYYAKFWLPRILSSADALIGNSFDFIKHSDAQSLYAAYPEKWAELPLGVDVERFKPRDKSQALLLKHNLDPQIPTLLFVGGMDVAHYFKGVPIFLQALKLLSNNNLRAQVLLIGDGELKEQFKSEAQALGLNRMVNFVGKISEEELPYYYNLVDLLVLPSINQGEAFGMVLLEAMASGVPVVATDLPGVREVAKDGGIVVSPNNPYELAEAIYGFFSENSDRSSLTKMVRVMAENKYAWSPIIDKLAEIYQQVAERKSV